MKREKGITLVTLIITIVILVILALVAVNSMGQTNIMSYTKNATKNWDESVANEQTELGQHEAYLDNASGTDSETTTVITFTITLANGEVRTYSAKEGMKFSEWITNSSYNTDDWEICYDQSTASYGSVWYVSAKEGLGEFGAYNYWTACLSVGSSETIQKR